MRKLYVAGLLFVLTVTFMSCNSNETKGALGSEAFHSFELSTLEGEKITLSDFKGKAVIVDIWDTWCPPCKAEIPHFVDLYKQYNSKGLEILGVAVGREGKEKVRQFIDDYDVNYHNALATQQFFQGVGMPSGIPTTYVLDTQGNIFKKYVGYRDRSVFEADIKAILAL